MVALADVHCLDNLQIVVERDDGVDQGDEDHGVGPSAHRGGDIVPLDTSHKDEELREHARKRGNAAQREEGERHEEAQLRIGGVETVVVADLRLATIVLLYHGDDGEDRHVGHHVDEDVVGEGGGTHLPARAHGSQHDVASLGDGAEGHEPLELILSDGEEVGDGDGEHHHDHHQYLPVHDHRAKDMVEDGEEREGCRTLGNDAQIARDGGWRTLVGVGGPEVEGHERNLEAQSAEEEDQSHEQQRRAALARDLQGHVVEVERAAHAVEEADAEEHHAAGECGGEDELRCCLGAVVAVEVEGHHRGQRYGGHLQAEEEQEEVAGAHHHEHTQQGAHREHIELALADAALLPRDPGLAHQDNDERAQGEDRLDDRHSGIGLIHAAEGRGLASGGGVAAYDRNQCQQEGGQRIEPTALSVLCGAEVGNEKYHQGGRQGGLGNHIEKLTVIHFFLTS